MLAALTLILTLQLVGEALARGLGLPLPGPVVGMALLFAGLVIAGGPGEDLRKTASGFLDNLGLLFVPAGVGVTVHLGRAAEEWTAIAAALIPATLVTLVATAWAFRLLDGSAEESVDGAAAPKEGGDG